MGQDTEEIDLGALDVPAADQVQPEVEGVRAALHAPALGYDLSDLNLDPDAVTRHVLLRRAEMELQEAGVAGLLAKTLMGLLCAGTLLYVILAFLASVETGLEAGTRILCFLTPLVGVVVGYYFSGKRQRS